MNPAAYDQWWRARIQKEETDYANHIQNSWQQSSSQKQQQSLRLNTLGAAQLINPSLQATKAPCTTAHCKGSSTSQQVPSTSVHELSRAAVNSTSQPAAVKASSRASSAVAAGAAEAPANIPAAPASHLSVARSSACAARSTVSRASTRLTAAAAGSAVGTRVRGSAVGAASAAGSAVSYPCTQMFSEVGSSVATSEVMSRLARLEAELAAERTRREAAEAEMRALMGSRGSKR